MAAIGYGNNTLNVAGSGNQFVVVYAADAPSFPPELAAFASFDQGPVFTITTGATSLNVAVSNQSFVVQYLQPAETSGNNAVTVNGANNAFVVSYEPSFLTTGTNTVAITGDDSRFVVAYSTPAAGNSVVVEGNANQFVVANSLVQAGGDPPVSLGMDPSVFSATSMNNNGVIVGLPTSDTVRVDGDNNLFVVQYAAPSGNGAFVAGLNPFAGAAVPVAEPSTVALVAVGLLAARFHRSRRGRREP